MTQLQKEPLLPLCIHHEAAPTQCHASDNDDDDDMQLQVPLIPSKTVPDTADKPEECLAFSEEFLIGCISGIVGAVVSWFNLGGLQWVLFVFFLPYFISEVWESSALFHAAAVHKGREGSTVYHAAMYRVTAKKRLAVMLFGQGVIMGQAATDLVSPSSQDIESFICAAIVYSLLWVGWAMTCEISHALPPQDKLANLTGLKKDFKRRYRHKVQRSCSDSSTARRRDGSNSLRSTQKRQSSLRRTKSLTLLDDIA
ncbi:expressed unknown protein [Seminavis robusta]|uniref:Uncharacterized protein n=1 Tax=Seminavis robusta TaxID=568900 RepID=A0A9N8H7F0_9STRA|nr:expressed unknown protein [Seminavis robusta]|eukprot:Sro202_g085280.1 n/a (255) ;mRNA; r:5777-6541